MIYLLRLHNIYQYLYNLGVLLAEEEADEAALSLTRNDMEGIANRAIKGLGDMAFSFTNLVRKLLIKDIYRERGSVEGELYQAREHILRNDWTVISPPATAPRQPASHSCPVSNNILRRAPSTPQRVVRSHRQSMT